MATKRKVFDSSFKLEVVRMIRDGFVAIFSRLQGCWQFGYAVLMSTYHPKQYKTKNWPTYNRSLIARGSITLLFDETMQWYGQRQGKQGKPQRFSEAAIQFCLSIKVLLRLPLRQCTGFVGSLLKLARLDWAVPDNTTLCRRQEQLNVSISYTPSREGLHLLVDSTGIKFLGEGEWKRKKHGVGYRRQWRKVHLGIDAGNPPGN
jgi:hypothetical protein